MGFRVEESGVSPRQFLKILEALVYVPSWGW
jgi:hypothetical protein